MHHYREEIKQLCNGLGSGGNIGQRGSIKHSVDPLHFGT